MSHSYKEMRAYAANPLHASLKRWQSNPIDYRGLCERAENYISRVRWHLSGDPMASNAAALEYVRDAIAQMKRVEKELQTRIEEGNQ